MGSEAEAGTARVPEAWAARITTAFQMSSVATEPSQGTIVALDTAWATEASQGTIMASFEALVFAWATAPFAVVSWEAIAFVAFAAPWEASAALWEAFDTALGVFPIA